MKYLGPALAGLIFLVLFGIDECQECFDNDADGYCRPDDCDDNDPSINSGRPD